MNVVKKVSLSILVCSLPTIMYCSEALTKNSIADNHLLSAGLSSAEVAKIQEWKCQIASWQCNPYCDDYLKKAFEQFKKDIDAASNNNTAVKKWLELRSLLDAKNSHGTTPLKRALDGGLFNIAEWLVENGASIDQAKL